MKLYIHTTQVSECVAEGKGRECFYVEPDCINYYIIVESESWFYFIYLNIYMRIVNKSFIFARGL